MACGETDLASAQKISMPHGVPGLPSSSANGARHAAMDLVGGSRFVVARRRAPTDDEMANGMILSPLHTI